MGFLKDFALEGAGSVVQGAFGLASAALQHKYEKENMEIQNQYQVEQWNRENQYNDPSAVANRYARAGINPQSALGSGSTGAGIAGGLSSAPSPTTSANPGSISAPDFMNLRRIQNETYVAESQANKNNAEAELARSRTPTDGNLGDAEIAVKESVRNLNNSIAELNAVKVDTEKAEQEKKKSETALNNIIREREQWNVSYLEQTHKYRVQEAEYNLKTLVENYEHLVKANPLLIDKLREDINLAAQNILYLSALEEVAKVDKNVKIVDIYNAVHEDGKVQRELRVLEGQFQMDADMLGWKKFDIAMGKVLDAGHVAAQVYMGRQIGRRAGVGSRLGNHRRLKSLPNAPSNQPKI